MRTDIGQDKPLLAQNLHYVGETARQNFGRSIKAHRSVVELIGEGFMPSL